MTLNGIKSVTLRYFSEVGKPALQKTICGGIYAGVYCILVRVCRRKESSRSLSHLLMSFLLLLANVNSRPRSLYVIVRPSVCRLSSATFVHPQAIEIFRNISTPCGTLAIHDLCIKILRRSSRGNPFVVGLNPRGVAKYGDFRPFEGYISETMQDMIVLITNMSHMSFRLVPNSVTLDDLEQRNIFSACTMSS